MLLKIASLALLLLAFLLIVYIAVSIKLQLTSRARGSVNGLTSTRSVHDRIKPAFRGRFRELAETRSDLEQQPSSHPVTPQCTPRITTRVPRLSLRQQHLATLGFSYMPEPRLLRASYLRLAAKWQSKRSVAETDNTTAHPSAEKRLRAIEAAYFWLQQNP